MCNRLCAILEGFSALALLRALCLSTVAWLSSLRSGDSHSAAWLRFQAPAAAADILLAASDQARVASTAVACDRIAFAATALWRHMLAYHDAVQLAGKSKSEVVCCADCCEVM